MRRSLLPSLFLICALLAPASPARSAPSTTAPANSFPARHLTVRGGIGNVAAKLKAGDAVTVAFLGGPITAGGGTSGYTALVVRWLRTQYPGREIRLINAGMVDGGSHFGAARYERDVLPHAPDLLFVEFAADDEGHADRLRHVERIVRKAWTADPSLDVVFLYALNQARLDDYRAGHLPPAAATHERVADHYGTPSIAMGLDLLQRFDARKARWVEQFYDASRPTPAGHIAYAGAVSTALRTLLADDTAQAAKPHELPEPLTPGLILFPATRPATTMPAPPPMTDADGRTAQETYALPVIGVHWVGSPEYVNAENRVLWRLFTQSIRDNGRRLNATFGLDRSRWGWPMRWFEEWTYFTGPSGVYLAHSADGKTNNLTARENDLPILTFTAPHTGRYIVRLKSSGVALWGLQKQLAMNVVHFPLGQTKGKSVAFERTQRGIATPLELELELQMNEGDDLAFEIDTDAIGGGGGAAWLELDLRIGWFGK